MGDGIAWLEQYLIDHANGEWEHDFGITIQSSDNPGWLVKIDLSGRAMEPLNRDPIINVRRSESEWITISKKDQSLIGTCGPANLDELLLNMRLNLY